MGETQQGGHTERQNNEAADNDNFDVSGKKSTLSIIGQERADVTHLKPRFPLSHCMRKAVAPCRSKKCEREEGEKKKQNNAESYPNLWCNPSHDLARERSREATAMSSNFTTLVVGKGKKREKKETRRVYVTRRDARRF